MTPPDLQTSPTNTSGGARKITAAQDQAVSPVPASVLNIPVTVQVVIGHARLPLSQVLELAPGTEIPLEEKLGSPAIILVNGKEIARGEIVVLDGEGERLAITITALADVSASDS